MRTRARTVLYACLLAAGLASLWIMPTDASEMRVRIGIADGVESLRFAASTPARILDAQGRQVATMTAMEAWSATSAGKLQLISPSGKALTLPSPCRVVPADTTGIPLVFIGDRWYRGDLEIRVLEGRIVGVNLVPLEEYLYGVVPAEMPSNWPLESLKAQAVAARTYAVANRGRFGSRGYDLKPTVASQVYKGAAAETALANTAVNATRGQVVTYNGKVIRAYFHASAGGYTESADAVWGESLPYLRPVPDFDQSSPKYTWHRSFSAKTIEQALSKIGHDVGDVLRIEPVQRAYSGRVTKVRVTGTHGIQEIAGEPFRHAIGLFSTLWNVLGIPQASPSPTSFAFAGRGHGHGLGMSQWGAKGLAEKGYPYAQILLHYYPSAQLSMLPSDGQ
jgi:stage II sporulation protein D